MGSVGKLTVADMARLEGVSERRVREMIKGKILNAQKEKSTKGAPGGRQWAIDPSSLSPKAKMKWQEQQHFAVLVESYKSELPVAPLSKQVNEMSVTEKCNPAAYRDAVGDEIFNMELARAREKYALAKQAQDILNDSKGDKVRRFDALAVANGIPPRTLREWTKQSEKGGVYGLMRKRPKVTQGKTFKAISQEVQVIIRKHYLQKSAPSVAKVLKWMQDDCKTNGLKAPSKATLYRYIEWLEETEPELCCYYRKPQYYKDKYEPHALREEPERIMQIVMGDHHKFDRFAEHNGKPIRPWVTAWYDVRSRSLVGWTISAQANGQTINLALVHMMSPKLLRQEDGTMTRVELGGIPEVLYIDNGEDYKAACKKGLKSPEFQLSRESLDICEYLGVKVIFATPYHAQAKAHIERFFGTVATQFSPNHVSWCGRNPGERPMGYDEHKLLAQGKLQTLQELAEEFTVWWQEYLNTEHGSLGMTPLAKHLEGPKRNAGWPDQRTLDILRCVKDQAKVYQYGISRFGTKGKPRYYWHEELDKLIGRDVIIRYDPAHLGEIHVYTFDGGYICTATNAELMKWGATQDDFAKLKKRKKAKKQAIRESFQSVADTYENIVAERQAAGPDKISSPTAAADGLTKAITGLDQAGRQLARAKTKAKAKTDTEATLKPKKHDPIEAYILAKGAN